MLTQFDSSTNTAGPIGIFDSGVGGISIYKVVKNLLPEESYIYLADKKLFPYGRKSTKIIFRRMIKVVDWFKSQNVKLIIIACNTATVKTIDNLREKYPEVLLVGTVPVIKTCAEKTQTGNISILCTETTAKSKYQSGLIKKFARDMNVYVEECPYLVKMIEEGNIENIKSSPFLLRPIEKLKKNNVDTIALGCSHFPLIGNEIQKIAGEKVLVLDSGHAIARRTKSILRKNSLLSTNMSGKKSKKTLFYTTAHVEKFDRIINKYMHRQVKSRLVKI